MFSGGEGTGSRHEENRRVCLESAGCRGARCRSNLPCLAAAAQRSELVDASCAAFRQVAPALFACCTTPFVGVLVNALPSRGICGPNSRRANYVGANREISIPENALLRTVQKPFVRAPSRKRSIHALPETIHHSNYSYCWFRPRRYDLRPIQLGTTRS